MARRSDEPGREPVDRRYGHFAVDGTTLTRVGAPTSGTSAPKWWKPAQRTPTRPGWAEVPTAIAAPAAGGRSSALGAEPHGEPVVDRPSRSLAVFEPQMLWAFPYFLLLDTALISITAGSVLRSPA